MNILVIAGFSAYPSYLGEKRQATTYAFHEVLKHYHAMNDVNIEVFRLRLRQFKLLNIFRRIRLYNTKNQCYYKNFIDGVHVHNFPVFKLPKIPVSKKVRNKVKDEIYKALLNVAYLPDIIICISTEITKDIAEYLKELYDCPIILCLRNCDVLNRKLYDISFNSVDYFSFRSERIKDIFTKYYNRNFMYSVDSFGIDEKFIDSVEENNIPNQRSKLHILSAGSLIPLKNFDILIRAIAGSLDYVATLDIYGEGPERKRLQRLIDANHLSNVVTLHSECPKAQVLDEMKAKPVFALLSAPETLGLVYLEALAKGCIVIGTKGEGIDGIIVDHENGFLCEANNVDMLKSIIRKIYYFSAEEKRIIMENAISTAQQHTNQFYLKKYIKNCESVIESYKAKKAAKITGN